MLRRLREKSAQVVLGEYVIVVLLGAATIVAMTVYFKRGLQARIHDSRDYMIGQVRERTGTMFNGNLYKEYEPYYTNTVARVSRVVDDETRLLPGASSGIFEKVFDETTRVRVDSRTAPPADFDLTTPIN